MTNELRRWHHRIDHGDVIQSPRGEYVLWADYDELAQAHMTLIGEFQAQEAELEALKHDNERFYQANVGLVNELASGHEPSANVVPCAGYLQFAGQVFRCNQPMNHQGACTFGERTKP